MGPSAHYALSLAVALMAAESHITYITVAIFLQSHNLFLIGMQSDSAENQSLEASDFLA